MTKRDTVLIVGSTGSLGRSIVVELLRRQYKLRLLVRSHASVVSAGYDKWVAKDLEIVVREDMTDRSQYKDEWFADVETCICVARPRSLKKGDSLNFGPMIDNLCDAVICNEVPRLLMHSMPYMETNPFGLESPTMKIRRDAELSARKHFNNSSVSSALSITKIAEMSEIAHIKQSVELLGFIPICLGRNPCLHPVSSSDFAIFIGDYVGDQTKKDGLLLVGGPQQMTWRELGQKIQSSSEQRLPFITLPLLFYRIIILVLGLCSTLIPPLRGLYISLLLTSVPMTTNTANKDFIFVGEDTVESFLRSYSTDEWVHKRVFGEKSPSLPSIKSFAQVLVGLFTASDGLVALFKPSVVGVLQNINVSDPTVDRFILIVFGIAACSISAVTFSSLKKGQETRAIGKGIVIQIALSVWYFCIGDVARSVGIHMPVIYIYIMFCTLALLRLMFHVMYPSTMAVSTIVISLVHYLQPSIVQYSLDIDPVNLGDKTLQHIRQAFMYHLANGVQMLGLACGVKPEKAVGMICLTWFICSMDFWFFKQVDEVFEMTQASRNINLLFPLWTGTLALILLYPKPTGNNKVQQQK